MESFTWVAAPYETLLEPTLYGEIKVKTEISTNVKLNENIQVKPSNDNIIIFDGETDKSLKSEFIN